MMASCYRDLTRKMSMSSLKEFETDDLGLKDSISRFSKYPRTARYFDSFRILKDWYSLDKRSRDGHKRVETIKTRSQQLKSLFAGMSPDSATEMSMSKGRKSMLISNASDPKILAANFNRHRRPQEYDLGDGIRRELTCRERRES